ncbi:MAG: hypothetical protein ACE5L6_02015 [Candidatus Bathyarchaeia archaeon]
MEWTFDPNLFALLVVCLIAFFLRTIAPWLRKRRGSNDPVPFDYSYGLTGLLSLLVGLLFGGALESVADINVLEWAVTTIVVQVMANDLFNRWIEPG